MAQPGQPDLTAILAALAAQRPAQTPNQQNPHGQPPAPGLPLPPYQMPPGVPAPMPGYPLPQPTNSGTLDLSAIKPVNSGSVSLNDALEQARSFASQNGLSSYEANRGSDSRNSYGRSRSRSRSPRHDSYNAFRDDRRGAYGRERSRSPQRAGPYSPQNNGRGYGRERSPNRRDTDDSEVISIESNLVGLVIGRQGENLRRIEQDTGARIQFITPADHGGPQRQCRVSGNLRARTDAKREIFRTIDDNAAQNRDSARGAPANANTSRQSSKTPAQPVLREGENAMQIMVPDRTVGLIIGRGGETIRDLQDRSGCHINIVGVNKSVNGLRPVNLIGSAQASQKAKDLILEIVESDTRGPQGQNDTPQPQQQQPVQNARPSYSNNANQDAGKINETIRVPSEAVGMIIGKGGETIREMQQSTQCKINVSQPSGADMEREIGLVGSLQAIEAAKRAIWDKVDLVREKGNQRRNDGAGDRQSQSQPYGQQGASSSYGQQPYGQQFSQAQQPAPAADASNAADPYAQWGGYQNYITMWYTALAQGAKPPGQE